MKTNSSGFCQGFSFSWAMQEGGTTNPSREKFLMETGKHFLCFHMGETCSFASFVVPDDSCFVGCFVFKRLSCHTPNTTLNTKRQVK